jgi:hypothetical protein
MSTDDDDLGREAEQRRNARAIAERIRAEIMSEGEAALLVQQELRRILDEEKLARLHALCAPLWAQ